MIKIEPHDRAMLIAIPTFMREKSQIAINCIPPAYHDRTQFFTRVDRVEALATEHPGIRIIPIPMDVVGIAATRQYVIDTLPPGKVWMIDDRVKIHPKRVFVENAEGKMVPKAPTGMIPHEDFDELYQLMSDSLNEYAQVGISPRAGNQNHPYEKVENHRIYSIAALRTDVMRAAGVRYDAMYQENKEILLYEDFYVTLKLLTRGYKNLMFYSWAFNHNHGEKGGNSTYRTHELQKLCAEYLASKFPKFARVHQKVNERAAWGDLAQRWDLRCGWKQSYKKEGALVATPNPDNGGSIFDMFG